MQLNKTHIEELMAKKTGKLKGTIYIPTNPQSGSQQLNQDQIRFKNALQVIRNDHAYDDRELGATLDKIYEELHENIEFWKHQDYGLAILFDAEGYEYFHLPFEVNEAEYLLDRYVVSPLLVTASADTSFYMLDVNFTNPRLYSATRGQFVELNNKNLPGSISETIVRTDFRDHSPGSDAAISEDEKRYLRQIVEAVEGAIQGSNRPLLLAGTVSRTGNIRKDMSYKHVLDQTLDGNYEKSTTQELYDLCTPILAAHFRAERDSAVEKLASSPPELVVMGKKEIEEAATAGRVATLFLPSYSLTKDSNRPGEDDKLILTLPADINDIETMVQSVLEQSGEIIAVEIGGYDVLDVPKALCRY